jgi:hypothetical protein
LMICGRGQQQQQQQQQINQQEKISKKSRHVIAGSMTAAMTEAPPRHALHGLSGDCKPPDVSHLDVQTQPCHMYHMCCCAQGVCISLLHAAQHPKPRLSTCSTLPYLDARGAHAVA